MGVHDHHRPLPGEVDEGVGRPVEVGEDRVRSDAVVHEHFCGGIGGEHRPLDPVEFLREAGRVPADRHRPVPDERFKEPEIVAAVGKFRKQPGGRLVASRSNKIL